MVALDHLAARFHATDTLAIGQQAVDRGIPAEVDAQLGRQAGQLDGEQVAVAGFVVRQLQGGDQLVLDPCQCRFDGGNAVAVIDLVRHAALFQHGDILLHRIDLLLGAEHLQRAELATFVVNTGVFPQRLDTITAIFGQPHHARLVDRIARRGAVDQHLLHPLELGQRAVRADGQRRMLLEQPLGRFQRDAGRRPRGRISRGDLSCVAEAGFQRRAGLAFDHGHVTAAACQIIRGGNPDNAPAENDDFHLAALYACAEYVLV